MMNNYEYLAEKWKNEHRGNFPVGPTVSNDLKEFRKLLFDRWTRHCDLDDKANDACPDEKRNMLTLIDWITNSADTAFDFVPGELVRVNGALGIVQREVATVYRGVKRPTSRYETLLVRTAHGTSTYDRSCVVKETKLPVEVLELAKAQLLGECPEVCPLRKEEK